MPTHAGIVWTDVGIVTSGSTGHGNVIFSARDANGVSLGTQVAINLGDGVGSATTAAVNARTTTARRPQRHSAGCVAPVARSGTRGAGTEREITCVAISVPPKAAPVSCSRNRRALLGLRGREDSGAEARADAAGA